MNRLKWFAVLLVILFVASSCYWTPETTTGSLRFSFSESSARALAASGSDRGPGAAKHDSSAEEAKPTHAKIYLYVSDELEGETDAVYDVEFEAEESSVHVTGVAAGDDYVVRLELGVLNPADGDSFVVVLVGESKPFQVSAGRTTQVQINKLQPVEYET